MESMTYAGTGVDYDVMDRFKVAAQQAAAMTAGNIARPFDADFADFVPSRGESVHLIESGRYDFFLAHVNEGLGTKNLAADAMYAHTGKSFYDQIAQDTVAMIVNDMVTLGAMPMSIAMHLAVGSSDWFDDQGRWQDLVAGWQGACDLSRCLWGGGETPTLKDMLLPGVAMLSGSALGLVTPKERLINGQIRPGDAIVIIESSGIHANGLTLARRIADKLPDDYLTEMSDGRLYGNSLLDPTEIYVGAVADILAEGIDIHYTANITGHGWRKLMRLPKPFTYVIDTLPTQLPIFDFIQEHGPVDDYEAYGNLNMGAGFALYVDEADVSMVIELAAQNNQCAYKAGYVEAGDKKVVIRPKDLEYTGDTLAVR